MDEIQKELENLRERLKKYRLTSVAEAAEISYSKLLYFLQGGLPRYDTVAKLKAFFVKEEKGL